MFQVTSRGLPKEKLAKEWRSKDESEARKLMMWKKEEEKREKSKARKAARARIRAREMRKEELKSKQVEKRAWKKKSRKRSPRKVQDPKENNCRDNVPVEVLRMLLKKFTGKRVKAGKNEGNEERKEKKWNGLRDERCEEPQTRKPKMCKMCKKGARKEKSESSVRDKQELEDKQELATMQELNNKSNEDQRYKWVMEEEEELVEEVKEKGNEDVEEDILWTLTVPIMSVCWSRINVHNAIHFLSKGIHLPCTQPARACMNLQEPAGTSTNIPVPILLPILPDTIYFPTTTKNQDPETLFHTAEGYKMKLGYLRGGGPGQGSSWTQVRQFSYCVL